ncbi:hypothetical protein [uncultured Aquimarina sp.]|uniref:hypothetical protein n=1 Tax=uncultured Aquimarina sp. TaxID=575652 RepID=UPI0026073CB9|nr:hypothetical protein [uncultured Aquimarina sp.]
MKKRIITYGLRFLIALTIPLVLVFLLNLFWVVDIRPDVIKDGITNEMESKGRQILQEMGIAHGKLYWKNTKTWTVHYNAKWEIPVAWIANHWPSNQQNVKFDAITNSFDSRATLLDGTHKNEVWGIQSWRTYKQIPEGEFRFETNSNLAFGNPTVHYFIELPFRASNAPIVTYAGTATKYGKDYELVFITWVNSNPNKNSDQYLLYINKHTKRLDFAEYMVREQFNFLNSTVTFEDYTDVDGILFPSRFYNQVPYMKFLTFHDGLFTDWNIDSIASDELRPNEKLEIIKDEKL